ncbi:hypothetical protein [Helicobacter canis]|uniref:hypothetical protein n=1 Tax=Helicobacter canis TaxID=29419 RepID=UPI000E0EC347|nr:hypothetical protein [Helicobacter canis]
MILPPPPTESNPRIRATFYTLPSDPHRRGALLTRPHFTPHFTPHAKATPPHTREQGERACLGERIEAFSILKGAILVVNCAALRENWTECKMQKCKSLGRIYL